jgi:hypothetical protein
MTSKRGKCKEKDLVMGYVDEAEEEEAGEEVEHPVFGFGSAG